MLPVSLVDAMASTAKPGLEACGRLYLIAKCKHLKVLDFRKVKLKVRSVWPISYDYNTSSQHISLPESNRLGSETCMQAKFGHIPEPLS